MKILITGGAGFIGSHIVDRLVEAKYEVVVLDNLSRGLQQNIEDHLQSKRVTFIEGDIRDVNTVKRACTGCRVVYHLAAQSNVMGAVEDMRYSFETNVLGTFNVLQTAREQGVRRFIFSSSREAYGEAQYLPVDENHPLRAKNAYGASKASAEMYCRVFQNVSEMEIVVLRLANVYGSRDFNRVIPIFINNVRNGEDLIIYGGEQVIDFVPVPFVVKIMLMSLDNALAIETPVNVGSGQGSTLFDLGHKIMQLFGGNQNIRVEPARTVEVVQYTTDVQRLKKVFGMNTLPSTLDHLKEMV